MLHRVFYKCNASGSSSRWRLQNTPLLHLPVMTNQILGHCLSFKMFQVRSGRQDGTYKKTHKRKGFSKRTFYAWLHGAVNLSLKRKNSTGTDNGDAHTHIAQKTEPLDLDIMPNVHANVGRPQYFASSFHSALVFRHQAQLGAYLWRPSGPQRHQWPHFREIFPTILHQLKRHKILEVSHKFNIAQGESRRYRTWWLKSAFGKGICIWCVEIPAMEHLTHVSTWFCKASHLPPYPIGYDNLHL